MIGAPGTVRWDLWAWVAAAMMAAAVSFSLLRIPVQVTDSLIVMLQAQAEPSAWIGHYVGEKGFLRPVYWVQTRLLLDASAGQHYYWVFRGFHAALVTGLFALLVVVARVRTRSDFAAFAFALLIVAGHHTFRGNVWEAYPVNHYLEVAVCCVAALALAQSRGGWWADLMAAAVFAIAALTLESGLIVWVVLVMARLTGLTGVSWRGVGIVTALLLGYFYVRVVYLSTGMPGLDERALGFGFGRLERDEVVARFTDRPYVLYAYNVVASVLSVILSEPRSGTFEMTRRWTVGQVTPSVGVAMVSSAVATGLMLWYGATRWRDWLAQRFTDNDRLVLVFAGVVGANAAISYAYTKDEVMSTAGVFYALAVFAVTRAALARLRSARSALVVATLAVILGAASVTWAIRATGLHYYMTYAAYYGRNEWVSVESWLRNQNALPTSQEGLDLVQSLRMSAIEMPMVHPYFLPRWAERWFELE